MLRDRCPGVRSCIRGRRGAQKHLSNLLHVVQVEGYVGVGGAPAVWGIQVKIVYPVSSKIYGALATSHKGKSRVDAEADFDRLFICIVGVECGVM
jgi:hypothetical protein